MGVVAKYKFNQNVYIDFIPEFNIEFTNYTITDEIDTNGFTIRIIESDSLPTSMRFGQAWVNGEDGATNKSLSLLEVYECDTSNMTNMQDMFSGCSSLTSLDVSNFNTENVTNMNSMFHNCSLLTSLDVSNFNTSKVTNMQSMFYNCSKLTSLDVSNFNTNQVTNMGNIFQNCSSLTSLDVSNFNTSKVTNMSYMFYNCTSLTSLDISNFNTSQATKMDSMFQNCSSLTSLDVSNFKTEKVTNMDSMFYNCKKLTSLNASNFNTNQVTSTSYMFYNCSSLTSLDISSFNTNKIIDMSAMFYNCSSLTSLDLSDFDTSSVTNMDSMFSNCSSLTSLDVSNFNTNKVTKMGAMFSYCSSLTSLDISSFNTGQVIDMNTMFKNCTSLVSLDILNFNTEKVTNMYDMFHTCSSLISLDLSNFNTSQVTNMRTIFTNTKNLTDIGMIYCNSDTINKISDLITTDTTIWYSDAKLEDLTEKENITYKEYKMNILESDEEINLRRIGDVYDELNLETGELAQYIREISTFKKDAWVLANQTSSGLRTRFYIDVSDFKALSEVKSNKFNYIGGVNSETDMEGIGCHVASKQIHLIINNNKLSSLDLDGLENFFINNNVIIQYQLETPIIKTINLEGKPSINWQGDTYLHLENNTLYPQLDCEIESINYYEIPKLKANTLYTLRYVGESTQCIFGGLTYKTENNMILTSGSSDNLLYFDKEVGKVVLIEGDVRDRNFDYFEGIESLGAVEIITHKTNMPIFAKGGRK